MEEVCVGPGDGPGPGGAPRRPRHAPAGRRVTGAHRPFDERELVFNLVWTGDVFDDLDLFTLSMIGASQARFRFVGNACPPEQLDRMERFAQRFPDRVVEVLDVSPQQMLRHGDALDDVLRRRDDGPLFAFVDPDIFARGPFLTRFLDLLGGGAAAVTSGRELWSRSNVRPADHPGVNGEYFFDPDGFVFGSPHFAIYRRDVLVDTVGRWQVGFSTAGNDIPPPADARLTEFGRRYWIYDTAKVVNCLLQADGHVLVHEEHADLVHVGGVSHFLAPPVGDRGRSADGAALWGEEADWGSWEGMSDRFATARYAASTLREVAAGRPAPAVPDVLDADLRARMVALGRDLEALVAEVGPQRTDARSASR